MLGKFELVLCLVYVLKSLILSLKSPKTFTMVNLVGLILGLNRSPLKEPCHRQKYLKLNWVSSPYPECLDGLVDLVVVVLLGLGLEVLDPALQGLLLFLHGLAQALLLPQGTLDIDWD